MRDIETLDQIGSTGTYAPIRTSKLQKKPEFRGSILSGLMDFAYSVPDFRRSNKGNLRHRLGDVIMLMALGRASGCVGRSEIIEFGRHNLNKFRKMGMLRNGVPSEATLCRIANGVDDLAMADRMREFAKPFHRELLKSFSGMEIICMDGKANVHRPDERTQPGYRLGVFTRHRCHIGYRGLPGKEQRDKGRASPY